jgi:thiamine-monophosphate kinase
MLVKDAGEFGLIGRIRDLLPVQPSSVIVGVGDDVAVLDVSGPEYLVATCDAQVEGVHFARGQIDPYRLGRKTAAVNISDVAAVGGAPQWALVSLAIPDSTETDFVENLYRGMCDELAAAGAAIVGGNVARLDSGIAVDFILLGKVAPAHLVLRRGARPGDAIMITGFPGESRAGLELVRRPGLKIPKEARERVLARHFAPKPRLREGQALARSGLVHAMIDVSDGLLADLAHICRASGAGAEIHAEKLPVSPAASSVAQAAGKDVLDWVLSGGEDYELLFAADGSDAAGIRSLLDDAAGAGCFEIGRITGRTGEVRVVLKEGEDILYTADTRGWDHFGGARQ